MTNKNLVDLTDEDIISSLKVIATTRNCNKCKIRNCKWGTCNCEQITANAALELINHQKSEIERLKKEVSVARDVVCKEFANKLEEKCGIFTPLGANWIEETMAVKVSDIDKILKETIGKEGKMANEEAIIDIRENIQPIIGGKSLDIAISAIEKQIPKKPTKTRGEIVCPTCKTLVGSSPYCRYCGQALDWSDRK